jgi:triosephosphate isomerase
MRVLCPPYVCLAAVRDAVAETGVAVGAQDVHHEATGAFTGAISAPMLAGLATWTIVGHSERRRDVCETDDVIGRKVVAARSAGLRTILCVGEQLADREGGHARDVVDGQLRGALATVDPSALRGDDPLGFSIAYEPVWAIGTGRNARGVDAAEMAGAIRATLGAIGFANGGEDVPILYGGSVASSNIDEFMAEPSIDGALVGGASLKPDEMAGIVARAGLTAAARTAAAV